MIANGHTLEAIWGYSLRTIQVFVDLIQVRMRLKLRDLVIAFRHAQGTDVKVFREFMNSLEED